MMAQRQAAVSAVSDGLVVHRSAWVEHLLDPLLGWIARADDDPFVPLRVVVQSPGMRRWLSHQIAQRIDPAGGGIVANIDFPFPGQVINEIVSACGVTSAAGLSPSDDPWDPDRLAWDVAGLLLVHGGAGPLAVIASELANERDAGVVGRRTWRLARSIADVFNDYVIYRPDVVAGWVAGSDSGSDGRPLNIGDQWQPWLWRALVERVGDPARQLGDAITALQERADRVDESLLPRSLAIFGLSTLPPRHLDVLSALSRHTTVEWFIPTPSPRRWDDVARTARQGGPVGDARHPLLIACGRLTDDAAWLVAQHAVNPADHDRPDAGLPGIPPEAAGQADMTSDTPPDAAPDSSPDVASDLSLDASPDTDVTLLARLQHDLRSDHAVAADSPRVTLAASDTSIRIHRCHGPARQAEALRDAVLGLMADDPTLEARDIIVLTPDVETFAPLVRGAFETDGVRPHLPVSVADRKISRSDPVADALVAVVRLARSRVSATDVLDTLGRDLIARKFKLASDDLARVTQWVAATGIRWGIDEHDRQRAGQPPDRHHTWRAGLDRLLLGVAMADEDDRVVGDVTPYDHMEGDDVDLLGRFAQACTSLFSVVDALRLPRSPQSWVEIITGLGTELFDIADDDRWRLHEIVEAFDRCAEVDDLAVDLAAIEAVLADLLGRRRGAAGYETGAVTLCELVPMRSIPHRVVGLLGLDDRAFPRASTRTGFDLIGRHRRVGDRERRDEDRHLFLEALLSARDHLIVVTTGKDARTNEPRPPAVVVSELCDTLDRISQGPDGTSGSRFVTIDHPLHAFSPAEFDASEPRSFDVALLEAARALQAAGSAPWPFLDAGGETAEFDEAARVDRDLAIDTLVRMLTRPIQTYLEDGLGVRLWQAQRRIEDSEPFAIHNFDRPALVRSVLQRYDDPESLAAWQRAILASSTIPAAAPGTASLAALTEEVALLTTKVRADLAKLGVGEAPQIDAADVSVAVGGLNIVGRVDLVAGAELPIQLVVDPRSHRPARVLTAWIHHLVASAVYGRIATVGVCKQGKKPAFDRFVPLGDDDRASKTCATSILQDLAGIAIAARKQPVPAFERATREFAVKQDMAAAATRFSSEFGRGDVDEYIEQAFGVDVALEDVLAHRNFDEEFRRLALLIWQPVADWRAGRIGELVKAVAS
ncbi:MAG: exodeoxyribonuclease V subunit gamma [Nitriliruptoraceae bacterium]